MVVRGAIVTLDAHRNVLRREEADTLIQILESFIAADASSDLAFALEYPRDGKDYDPEEALRYLADHLTSSLCRSYLGLACVVTGQAQGRVALLDR